MSNRSFNILLILTLFSSALFTIITPMAEEITIALALESEGLLAIINSIFLMTSAFCSLFWAFFGDRFSRKILLIIATLEWSIFSFLTIFATDFNSLLLFQILTAIGFGAVIPLTFSLTIDLFNPNVRGIKFGVISACYILGNGIGQMLSGFMSDYPWFSWQIPIIIVSISGFLCVILLYTIHEPKRGAKDGFSIQSGENGFNAGYRIKMKDLKLIWKYKTTLLILCFNFVMFVGIGATSSFFISMLKNDHGLSPTSATTLLLVIYGIQIPSGILIGRLGDHIYQKEKKGRLKVVFICLSIASISYIIGYSLAVFSKSLTTFIAFFILILLGAFLLGGIDPLMQATLGEVSPSQIRTTVYSINYLATVSFGRSISLLILGQLFIAFNDQYSPGYIFLSIITLSSIILLVPILKHLIGDMERIKRE